MSIEESLEALRAMNASFTFETRNLNGFYCTRLMISTDDCGRQTFFFPVGQEVDWEVELSRAVEVFRMMGDPEHKAAMKKIRERITGKTWEDFGVDDSE